MVSFENAFNMLINIYRLNILIRCISFSCELRDLFFDSKCNQALWIFFSGLIPDKEVRVSVKALAISCVGTAAALHPEAFFNSLYLEPLDGIPVEGKGQA